jgi:glutathione-regulated potassium-efflux system ancillary protein KefC/glutathione-regulated potassium-efflux system protein KefB
MELYQASRCISPLRPGSEAMGATDRLWRESFESALLMGRHAVLALGATEDEAQTLESEVRGRDTERFALETAGGVFAGRALLLGNIERIDPPRHDTPTARD